LITLDELSDDQLIALYGEVMAAMLERGIIHSANHPIADIAERLVADHYGVEPEPPNKKVPDVIAKDGTRVSGESTSFQPASRNNSRPRPKGKLAARGNDATRSIPYRDQRSGGGQRPKELVESIGIASAQVSALARKLQDSSEIKKSGKGFELVA
jgi:hypothetical protein